MDTYRMAPLIGGCTSDAGHMDMADHIDLAWSRSMRVCSEYYDLEWSIKDGRRAIHI